MMRLRHFYMQFGRDDDGRTKTTIFRYDLREGTYDGWFLISIGDTGLFKYRSIDDNNIDSDGAGKLITIGIDMV